ncbi:MAG: hypothetical protein Fur0018_02740 [Anaerolineales bacterium]
MATHQPGGPDLSFCFVRHSLDEETQINLNHACRNAMNCADNDTATKCAENEVASYQKSEYTGTIVLLYLFLQVEVS